MGVTLWLPKKRVTPYREIPAEQTGDLPVIIMDGGTLDGHQEDEIRHKVQEDREAARKTQKRYLPPRHVGITTLVSKATRKIVGYLLEVKEL